MLELKKVEALPPVKRGGGRSNQEREQIKEALLSGEAIQIENKAKEKEYPALQQRIRTAAKDIPNMEVKIRFDRYEDDPNRGDVYFQGFLNGEDVVAESEITPDTPTPKGKRTAKADS